MIRGELPGDCDCVSRVKARAEAAFPAIAICGVLAESPFFRLVSSLLPTRCVRPQKEQTVFGSHPTPFWVRLSCSSRTPSEASIKRYREEVVQGAFRTLYSNSIQNELPFSRTFYETDRFISLLYNVRPANTL
jgi:hypothetical protein